MPLAKHEDLAEGGHGEEPALSVCDVGARKLDKARPMLASAVIGVERSQRRSLEATVTNCIARDKCLLFVDFATHDEMPLVVQLRGEQLGLSMAPAAPVLQEARQGGQFDERSTTENLATHAERRHASRSQWSLAHDLHLHLVEFDRDREEHSGEECRLRLLGATRASATPTHPPCLQ